MGMSVSGVKSTEQQVVLEQTSKKVQKEKEKEEGFFTGFTKSDWSGKQLEKLFGKNSFTDWLQDKDKVCTDNKDDGSLSFGEGLKSFAKGLFGGIPKAIINHPLTTAVTMAVGVGAMVLTGGAAAPILWGIGAVATGAIGATNVYKYATAKTDGEAKAALEGTGTAVQSAALLGATYTSTLKSAQAAGVNTKGNIVETMIDSGKISARNVKGNYLTWKTGVIHTGSNKLKGAQAYMSKANDVEAYRFNPNGTPEEILANNPGVFRGADGNYYLPNKWSPSEPYLIDMSKEQMIMLYGGDDMAVCDGAIFKGSYVDTKGFHSAHALKYQDPAKLAYGEVVKVTKQAPGAFKFMSEGTKIQTLEGVRTVGEGEVVALDHAGNPYATTPANILKRNTGFTDKGQALLNKALPQ